MTDHRLRDAVREFWDAHPCATGDVPGADTATAEFFRALDERRFRLEPFIDAFARFDARSGRRVVEIGSGTGGDLLRFAQAGARVVGVDLSERSLGLVRTRFRAFGLQAQVVLADAQELPFADRSFDLAYSWGVLHHAPDTAATVREVHRVLVDGGEARVMLYHRHSLFALQAWLRYGLLAGRPSRSLREVLATHVESPGTKGYTQREAEDLFSRAGFADVSVVPVLTVWDARLGRRLFLPRWCRAILPDRWGFFLLISARRLAA